MRTTIFGMAALLTVTALPAFAAWDRIGSVDFSRRDTHKVQYGNFGGPIEALALRARGGDLYCDSVTATFGNGRTREVFRGDLVQGREITLDLPGDQRRVERLDLDCRPTDSFKANVAISADVVAEIGRYQDDWRKSPDWENTWSKIFDWANPDRR